MSLQKTILIDGDTNETYEVLLSSTDYEKALTDKNVVSQLLQNVKENGINPKERDVKEVMFEQEERNMDKENNSNKNDENSGQVIWSKNATLAFLALYQEYALDIDNGRCSQKSVFQKISKKLTETKFVVSPKQCMTKLTSMKRMYKKIKDHNSKSGNDRQTWQYYDQMEEIFGKKPWVKPLCTLSSTENDSDEEVTVTTTDKPPAKKAKLSSVDKHLEKLLEMKDKAREEKKAFHESAMHRFDTLNNLLQKIIEKEDEK